MDIDQMKKELAELRSYKEAHEKQGPVIRISGGRVVDFNPNYGGNVSEGEFYAKPVPADKPGYKAIRRTDLPSNENRDHMLNEAANRADYFFRQIDGSYKFPAPDGQVSQIIEMLLAAANIPADKPDHWAVISPGRADQYRAESVAVRKELGFSSDSDEVAPIDLLSAIRQIRADRSRITEQDAREIANNIFGYVGITYLTAAFENWFGKFGGRELLNKLNADREQVPTNGELLRFNSQKPVGRTDGSGNLKTYAAHLPPNTDIYAEQVPAVAVPDDYIQKILFHADRCGNADWEADVRNDYCAYLCGPEMSYDECYFENSHEAVLISLVQPKSIKAIIRRLLNCESELKELRSAPSHSQQSARTCDDAVLHALEKAQPFVEMARESGIAGAREAEILMANVYDTVRDRCPSHESEQGGEA